MIRKLTLVTFLFLISSVASATTCSVSTSGIAFGTYLPFSTTPTNTTGSIALSCKGSGNNSSIPITTQLNAGANSGGSFSNRRMISGTSYLIYQLYTNASHSQVWGDGLTGGTSSVSGVCAWVGHPPQCTLTQTIYGQIPAGQTTVVPGSYADTITVTVTY